MYMFVFSLRILKRMEQTVRSNFVLCLALSLIIQWVNGQNGHYCGSHLSDVLELICGGRFHRAKRSVPSISDIVKRSASGGIVEECCLQSCSFATLSTYCAEPQPLYDQATSSTTTTTESIEQAFADIIASLNLDMNYNENGPNPETQSTTSMVEKTTTTYSQTTPRSRWRNNRWFFVIVFNQGRMSRAN